VVWDNSDRLEYELGLQHLENLGFGRLRFYDLGPSNHYAWETSVLSLQLPRIEWPIGFPLVS
jgi:hypothetical protein